MTTRQYVVNYKKCRIIAYESHHLLNSGMVIADLINNECLLSISLEYGNSDSTYAIASLVFDMYTSEHILLRYKKGNGYDLDITGHACTDIVPLTHVDEFNRITSKWRRYDCDTGKWDDDDMPEIADDEGPN